MRLTKDQQKHLDKLYARAIDLQDQRAAVPSTLLRQPEWDRLHEEYMKVQQEITAYLAGIKTSEPTVHAEPAA